MVACMCAYACVIMFVRVCTFVSLFLCLLLLACSCVCVCALVCLRCSTFHGSGLLEASPHGATGFWFKFWVMLPLIACYASRVVGWIVCAPLKRTSWSAPPPQVAGGYLNQVWYTPPPPQKSNPGGGRGFLDETILEEKNTMRRRAYLIKAAT
jgi:hypothetical protein